jgi:hypothetical protein
LAVCDDDDDDDDDAATIVITAAAAMAMALVRRSGLRGRLPRRFPAELASGRSE